MERDQEETFNPMPWKCLALRKLIQGLDSFYTREAFRLFKIQQKNPSKESWNAMVEEVKELKKRCEEDQREFDDYMAFLTNLEVEELKQDEIDELRKPSLWTPSRRHSISDPTKLDC